jgi:hypothetical protein
MLKGYRIAGKTETKQKGLKSFIYLVLKMQTGAVRSQGYGRRSQ